MNFQVPVKEHIAVSSKAATDVLRYCSLFCARVNRLTPSKINDFTRVLSSIVSIFVQLYIAMSTLDDAWWPRATKP